MSEGTAAREENKCSLAAELLGCCGELRLRATGTSMLPALWPSDLITIRAEEFDRVAPGDIILYARGNRFFIHRVVKAPVDNGCRTLITRGDAAAAVVAMLSPKTILQSATMSSWAKPPVYTASDDR